MIDRDKVIKGIKCCSNIDGNCGACPYDDDFDCNDRVMLDTIELLKADQLELIRQRERIETLERIFDRLEQAVKENLQYSKILAMRR